MASTIQPSLQRAQKRSPERAVLAVAHVEPRTSRRPSAATPVTTTTAWDTTRYLTRAVQVELHDHREPRLADPAAAFEQAREERAVRSFEIRSSRSPAVVETTLAR